MDNTEEIEAYTEENNQETNQENAESVENVSEENTVEEENANTTEDVSENSTDDTQVTTEEISLENVENLLHDVIEMQAYNYTVNLYFFVSLIIIFVIYLLYRFINHFIDF